ncbi:PREDICTED: cytochrome P450 82A1-like [Ipomoea nil]|uniref:cytochrome P450 82A1-like n=1 Tax=Ipomoea nil TaxID=35883 RepID=UPI000900CC65|nr:PREDICTED: cytochrome P450 82A1-like [Ipomoea nil]
MSSAQLIIYDSRRGSNLGSSDKPSAVHGSVSAVISILKDPVRSCPHFKNLIVGGADTTSIMLTWAQEELDIVVGEERKVNESDIKNLVYLQAIVKETFRMYPAPLGGPRMFIKDCIVSSFHVPKDTWLFLTCGNSNEIHKFGLALTNLNLRGLLIVIRTLMFWDKILS